MLRNRLCYGLVLLGTGLFFLCYNGYVSYYVFLLSLLLPVVSLALSLPGMLTMRLSLSLDSPDPYLAHLRKGEAVTLRLGARCPWPFTGSRVKLRLAVRNTLTGEERREWLVLVPSRKALTLEHSLASSTCGLVECTLARAKACDLLGLFSLPVGVKRLPACRAFFFPGVYSPLLQAEHLPALDGEGERYSPTKPGDDPTELFGLRPYRQGDRLSQVHWKLSQKAGQTLVKELSLPVSDHILFLLDLNGSGWDADLLLDAFATLSDFLAQQGIAHRVGFLGKAGGFRLVELTAPQDTRPALEALLTLEGRAPLPPLAREDLPGGVSHALVLTARTREPLLALLRDRYPSARCTVIRAFSQGDGPLGEGDQILLRPGRVQEALQGLTL